MKKIKEEEMEINTTEKIEEWFEKWKGKKCTICLNLELDKHKKFKMKNLYLTSVTRNNNLVKQPQLWEYLPNHNVLSRGSNEH